MPRDAITVVHSATFRVPAAGMACRSTATRESDAGSPRVGVVAAVDGDSVDLDAEAAIVGDDDHRGCTGTDASMYRCAAAVAACSIAPRSAAAPLKRTYIPGCVSGRISAGHTRTRAHHRFGELWTTEGVTLIVEPLYSLITGGRSAGICAALGTLELCGRASSDASINWRAAAVAVCSTARRSDDAPLKLISMPGCVSGLTSGGHTRTCARHRRSRREGVTLIVQSLYWLTTGGWPTGRGGALEQAASTI